MGKVFSVRKPYLVQEHVYVASFSCKIFVLSEKHKAYHQKDEALAKDGFKKFMKYEPCNYAGCRYSKAANHIHCIRPGKSQFRSQRYFQIEFIHGISSSDLI